jgi:hypothetical protein
MVKTKIFSPRSRTPDVAPRGDSVPDVVELPLSEVVSKARVEAMPLAPAANDDDVDDLAAADAVPARAPQRASIVVSRTHLSDRPSLRELQ